MSNLYGLIFDVDGVIADTEEVNARASIKMFADLFGLTGIVRQDFQAGLGRGAEAYVQAAARIHGLHLTPEQVEQATRIRQENFLRILADEPLPAFEGVLELIAAAMARDDFRVAIATSGTREKSQAVLDSAKVPYQKMIYIAGSDVKNKKPHPELFLTAANRCGIEPTRCVVIEDAPNGIAAANAAGSKCIAVTNSTTAENLALADIVVPSLTQVSIETVKTLCDMPG
ncbi:MAG: HAD family phosphatase [Planctomycetota bacterium]